MKRTLAVVLIMVMMLSLAACGEKPSTNDAGSDKSAIEVLNSVWSVYKEEEKFPCGGGNGDTMSMEGPGEFDAKNTEELDATLGLAAADAANIETAASMMHMMNANNFTGAAYTLKSGTDAKAFIENTKTNILARQWICGIPETLVIINVNDSVILTAFGSNEIISTFKTNVLNTLEGATVAVEQAVTENF